MIDSEGDFLQTLENCKGHYVCPTDLDGKPIGPIVGYTASYKVGDRIFKKWVGLEYFNFSKADMWPAVLTFFAKEMARRMEAKRVTPDVIIGAPWAGVKFSQEVARLIGCRHIYAEKEFFGLDGDGRKIEKIVPGRYEGEINPGDRVVIGEELVNNTSTTDKIIKLIEDAGGHVTDIICAVNRSFPFRDSFELSDDRGFIPIIGVIERSTPQYRQDDPIAIDAIAEGSVSWKPKYDWDWLKAVMDTHREKAGIS